MEKLTVNQHGYDPKKHLHHDLFNPCHRIPPTNPTADVNMSPLIGNFCGNTDHAQCSIFNSY